MQFLAIIFSCVLVNNIVLTQFLGLCPFMGISGKKKAILGMGLATSFVLILSSIATYLMEHFLLIPFGIEFLKTPAFIVAIAVLVGLTEIFLAKTTPFLFQILGIYLPLITTNCAVLGVALLNSNQGHNFFEAISYAFGCALGFTLALLIFSALRERLEGADIPAPFKGTPIAFISAGILALAFMGLSFN